MANTIPVNPLHLEKGDKFFAPDSRHSQTLTHDPKICPTQPEFVHINGGCWDGRFASFEKVVH